MENSVNGQDRDAEEGSESVFGPLGYLFGLFGLFIGAVFAFGGLALAVESVAQFGWTATSGLVIETLKDGDSEAVLIRFVDDREQTWALETSQVFGNPSVESTVEVRYPPGDPEQFTLDSSWTQFGLFMGAGVVLLVIGAFVLLVLWICLVEAIRARRLSKTRREPPGGPAPSEMPGNRVVANCTERWATRA